MRRSDGSGHVGSSSIAIGVNPGARSDCHYLVGLYDPSVVSGTVSIHPPNGNDIACGNGCFFLTRKLQSFRSHLLIEVDP